jgi:hypothetical protein
MVNDIGKIIIGKIDCLPFLHKFAGVVRTVTIKDAGVTQRKVFPVSCECSLEDCNKGRYMDLCPDTSKKSVLYLEDTGLRLVNKEGHRAQWKATLNLVCWLNLPKLGQTSCSYSAVAIGAILKQLPLVPFNANDTYSRVFINVVGEQPKTLNPFAKYSYDETVNQFLFFPYDYFVLALEVDFSTDLRCLTIPEIPAEIDCLVK